MVKVKEGSTTTITKVKRLVNAIGGMTQYNVSGFDYVAENENTGIYVGTEFDMAQGLYNLIIDTNDPRVVFNGMKIGDTQASASAKLKTAGFINGGQNPQGYQTFVHRNDPEIVFVGTQGGIVTTYQYVAIDPSLVSAYSHFAMPRQYVAYRR